MPPSNGNFARQLRRFRHRAGFTQEELAEKSGLSRNYIGLLELARREPSLSSLLSLSRALQCSLDELTGMREGAVIAENASIGYRSCAVSPEAQQIMEAMSKCRPADLKLIAQVVNICAQLAGAAR